MARHVVAPVSAVPPGGRLVTEAGGKQIVIFNLGGEFFGLLNRCPHQGGPLAAGITTGLVEADPARPGCVRYSRAGEILRCPWHGWEFDIRTGLSRAEPARIRTRSYPAGAVGAAELTAEELAATTIPVSVEDSLIVVEV
ncbi:Rieske (2Fe-2S) protein [Falsiroseomonas sp. HW251]|uniref:Rieske (2Fe-2S) protein n=1 Tax=Falsiroseomonas sp. HW251 TaxID=3390998 RepID=UPI003D3166EA